MKMYCTSDGISVVGYWIFGVEIIYGRYIFSAGLLLEGC